MPTEHWAANCPRWERNSGPQKNPTAKTRTNRIRNQEDEVLRHCLQHRSEDPHCSSQICTAPHAFVPTWACVYFPLSFIRPPVRQVSGRHLPPHCGGKSIYLLAPLFRPFTSTTVPFLGYLLVPTVSLSFFRPSLQGAAPGLSFSST